MQEEGIENQQRDLSPEEEMVVQALEFYSHPFSVETLARVTRVTEQQVRQDLTNLGLLDLVSEERVTERKLIGQLARQAWAALARAAQEDVPQH